MSSYTSNLNLLKKDPTTDGNDTFNIKTMLNDNWDKIDDFCNSSKAKIKMGTYVGTGTSGSDNANTLTFDFAPKLIFIIGQGGYTYNGHDYNVRAILIRNKLGRISADKVLSYVPKWLTAEQAAEIIGGEE